MDGEVLVRVDRAPLVDGLTNDVNDSAEGLRTDGHLDRHASVDDSLASDQTFGGVKCDGAHVVTTEMLGNLQDEPVVDTLNLERVKNGRKVTLELHIDDGTNDLGDLAVSQAAEGPCND